PGGALGRRSLFYVRDVMHTGADIPLVSERASLLDALTEMTNKKLGMTGVTTSDGRLAGIFTDGDLRRVLQRKVDVNNAKVAGVMTDGGLWYDETGVETKRFNVRDGHGIKLLQQAGVDVAILSGRRSGAVERRASELSIRHVYQGIDDKLPVCGKILTQLGV